jgi:hypothetical protein
MAAVIDTLKLARALRDKGGFTAEAAEATAAALGDALGGEVATRADIDRLSLRINQLATKTDLAELRADLLKWVFGQTAVIVAIIGGLMALFHFSAPPH